MMKYDIPQRGRQKLSYVEYGDGSFHLEKCSANRSCEKEKREADRFLCNIVHDIVT